jgi:mRNA deadenylase 3'-5' endonuclease subunit Ccr4
VPGISSLISSTSLRTGPQHRREVRYTSNKSLRRPALMTDKILPAHAVGKVYYSLLLHVFLSRAFCKPCSYFTSHTAVSSSRITTIACTRLIIVHAHRTKQSKNNNDETQESRSHIHNPAKIAPSHLPLAPRIRSEE